MKSRLAKEICEELVKMIHENVPEGTANTEGLRSTLRTRAWEIMEHISKASGIMRRAEVTCNWLNNPPEIIDAGDIRLHVVWLEYYNKCYYPSRDYFRVELGKEGVIFRPNFEEEDGEKSTYKSNEVRGVLF